MEARGLKIGRKKTEYLGCNEHQDAEIHLQGEAVKRVNVKIKRKVYRTVVRPAMMYGADTWALKKAQEKKLEVAETRMLRWMCGGTNMDKMRIKRIGGTTKVGEITKKVQERSLSLKW